MARNEARRKELLDAGLRVLAASGARGLTHRAVDREAGVPIGTSSNYFRSRSDLVGALAGRVFERIGPEPERLDELAEEPADLRTSQHYLRYILERLTRHDELTVALFELRLEARRNPAVADVVRDTLQLGYAEDVRFNAERGLPGGPFEIALLHYALDGLVLDLLTTPVAPDVDPYGALDELVRRLVPDR
ncbi:MAG: TetR/AcrR family transcriptional regulator [Acidimicrobiales bacterium]